MEQPEGSVSAADRPSIIELSPDEVRRARSDALISAGIERKADKLLDVRGLKTQFFTADGIIQAVDDVSFDVDYGETLGLVGESGCGKSVSALSIARLVPDPPGKIVAGQILFDGIDVLSLSNEAMRKLRGKEIGFIFQDPLTSLNPTLTIGYQIGESIREHMGLSSKAARDRVVELLAKVGIPRPHDRLKDYPHQFSGGMRQRVMIAIALSCDPKLILADEPTTALDVTIQAQILDLIRNLRDETDTAIILITHDLGVVAEMCDRVAVMYAGEIVEQTDVATLFREPRHPYTQGLIGSIPVVGVIRDELAVIPGNVPNLIDLPVGCRFAPRCTTRVRENVPYALDIHPELRAIGPDHEVRCWLYHDLEGRPLQRAGSTGPGP